jgi:hypothetical protein
VNKVSESKSTVYLDTSGLTKLARDLRALGPAQDRAVRLGIRHVVNKVRDAARSNASFSTRIPGSVKSHVSVRGLSGSVSAGGSAAPDAAPIENRGKGHVRHPIFGDKTKWTDKNSHSAFLAPAVRANAERLILELSDLFNDIIKDFCR